MMELMASYDCLEYYSVYCKPISRNLLQVRASSRAYKNRKTILELIVRDKAIITYPLIIKTKGFFNIFKPVTPVLFPLSNTPNVITPVTPKVITPSTKENNVTIEGSTKDSYLIPLRV
ncbi:hypothetical protein LZ30DRAFT_693838 [Colletotrichum cereale]|nr:hypothetical protein LZ30DRAFT_693838 [Colletotrichum cereale]